MYEIRPVLGIDSRVDGVDYRHIGRMVGSTHARRHYYTIGVDVSPPERKNPTAVPSGRRCAG